MGRPKGSTNKAVDTQGVGTATKAVVESATTVIDVKVEKADPLPLKKGGAFLVNVNGADEYWSKSMLDIAFKRKSHSIEIPKGSSYIPPVNSKCENCG